MFSSISEPLAAPPSVPEDRAAAGVLIPPLAPPPFAKGYVLIESKFQQPHAPQVEAALEAQILDENLSPAQRRAAQVYRVVVCRKQLLDARGLLADASTAYYLVSLRTPVEMAGYYQQAVRAANTGTKKVAAGVEQYYALSAAVHTLLLNVEAKDSPVHKVDFSVSDLLRAWTDAGEKQSSVSAATRLAHQHGEHWEQEYAMRVPAFVEQRKQGAFTVTYMSDYVKAHSTQYTKAVRATAATLLPQDEKMPAPLNELLFSDIMERVLRKEGKKGLRQRAAEAPNVDSFGPERHGFNVVLSFMMSTILADEGCDGLQKLKSMSPDELLATINLQYPDEQPALQGKNKLKFFYLIGFLFEELAFLHLPKGLILYPGDATPLLTLGIELANGAVNDVADGSGQPTKGVAWVNCVYVRKHGFLTSDQLEAAAANTLRMYADGSGQRIYVPASSSPASSPEQTPLPSVPSSPVRPEHSGSDQIAVDAFFRRRVPELPRMGGLPPSASSRSFYTSRDTHTPPDSPLGGAVAGELTLPPHFDCRQSQKGIEVLGQLFRTWNLGRRQLELRALSVTCARELDKITKLQQTLWPVCCSSCSYCLGSSSGSGAGKRVIALLELTILLQERLGRCMMRIERALAILKSECSVAIFLVGLGPEVRPPSEEYRLLTLIEFS